MDFTKPFCELQWKPMSCGWCRLPWASSCVCVCLDFLLQPLSVSQTSQTESVKPEEWAMSQVNLKLWVHSFQQKFTSSSFRSSFSLRMQNPLRPFHSVYFIHILRLRWWCSSCGLVVVCLQEALCDGVMCLLCHHCLAWRGLWHEGDASAEVPAHTEWDSGTHSGGGQHPGEGTTRRIDAYSMQHSSFLIMRQHYSLKTCQKLRTGFNSST